MSVLTDGIMIREVSYGPGERQPVHSHPVGNVTLVLDGAIRERVGRTEVQGQSLSIVAKPAGVEHANEVGRHGAHTLQVVLLNRALLPEELATLSAWRWLHGGPAIRPLLALLRAVRARDAGTNETVERGLIELFACLSGDDTCARPDQAPAWLHRVKDEIDDNAGAGPAVGDLARSAGVHRVHLAREFRRLFGQSVSGYIQTRRVQTAARMLARADAPLTEVAFTAGFADQSHMCRVFKAGTGTTPAAWRRLAARPV